MNCKCKMCGASFSSKLALTLYSLFSLCCTNSFAQNCNNRLSIQVIDLHDGTPLENATVQTNGLKGTTDFDGNFSINAEEGDTLNISYVGYQSQSIVVGDQDTLNISLELGNELEEVVVTSLGIKREAKALGYAVQSVSAEDITDSGANSAIDAMVGKVAGVQITRSSGSVGGGSRIIVRGVTSMIGNNQALIVIDGVRSNNESLNSGSSTAGTSVSNRLMDLNNEDIASINVLKGAAATSLYGTSGSNGVIVITTKKGQASKMNVNFSTEVSSSEMLFSTDDKNFAINLTSRRNNFEMIMLIGFAAAGKAIIHQKYLQGTISNYNPVIPDQVNVVVTVPMGRDNTIFSAEANAILVQELADGSLDSADFMRKIKDSIQTL